MLYKFKNIHQERAYLEAWCGHISQINSIAYKAGYENKKMGYKRHSTEHACWRAGFDKSIVHTIGSTTSFTLWGEILVLRGFGILFRHGLYRFFDDIRD